MSPQTLIVRVRLFLLALIALALLLAAALWQGEGGEPLRVLRPAIAALPDEAVLGAEPQGDLAAALQRPLFWQARTAVTAETAAVTPEASAAIEGFKLLGIVRDRNKSIALLGTPQGVKRVGVDDKVQGWTVEQLDSTRVTLSSADRRVELSVLNSRRSGIRLEPTDAQ